MSVIRQSNRHGMIVGVVFTIVGCALATVFVVPHLFPFAIRAFRILSMVVWPVSAIIAAVLYAVRRNAGAPFGRVTGESPRDSGGD